MDQSGIENSVSKYHKAVKSRRESRQGQAKVFCMAICAVDFISVLVRESI